MVMNSDANTVIDMRQCALPSCFSSNARIYKYLFLLLLLYEYKIFLSNVIREFYGAYFHGKSRARAPSTQIFYLRSLKSTYR